MQSPGDDDITTQTIEKKEFNFEEEVSSDLKYVTIVQRHEVLVEIVH